MDKTPVYMNMSPAYTKEKIGNKEIIIILNFAVKKVWMLKLVEKLLLIRFIKYGIIII